MLQNLIIAISVFFMMNSAFCGPKREVPVVHKNKALVIEGVISNHNIAELGDLLIQKAASGQDFADLIINSPGGEVITGFMFEDKMETAKSLGLKINCFVPEIAASMAFSILTHCDKRYTLNKSFLLWHRARISGAGGQPLTAPDLLTIGRDLEKMDSLILDEVLDTVGKDMSRTDVEYHFEAQTLHVGSVLHELAPRFITAYDSIPGLYEALQDQKVPRTKSNNFFFKIQVGGVAKEYIYIYDKYLVVEDK